MPQQNSGQPNILFVMVDQQRFDTIAALGNPHVYTPNLDRLVRRGVAFTNAYSSCPVCVPARYVVRTGCEPPATGSFSNGAFSGPPAEEMEERCGPFLARRMGQLGYRTFGIGKFHARHQDLGYEVFLRAEEMWVTPEQRAADAYAGFIAREHPAFDYIEQLHGERTEMYYMPQTSPLPAEITYEAWTADRAVEQVAAADPRPWFGFLSFIGPHPPFAPPIPFNRLYDPDRMPNPVRGEPAVDHLDEQIPHMNYLIWGDDINDMQARALKARYYGEITYLDHCLGRLLDEVEGRADADNTLICFFSDHGDLLGDHHGWQKECYFDAACRIPFLVSWPARLPSDVRNDGLAALTDLFGIATSAAGPPELREGHDLLGMLAGRVGPRDHYVGMYEAPGSQDFKVMVRQGEWKYIYMANGGREQLFNLADDPHELRTRADDCPDTVRALRDLACEALQRPNADRALEGGRLKTFPFRDRPRTRINQMDRSRGVAGFPADPAEVLRGLAIS
ncbi:MAG: sulfatase family protein [Armatimonadota bacterium]